MEIKKKTKKIRYTPYLLIAPSLLLFCMFIYFPFVKSFLFSFAVTNRRGELVKWVGLSNWIRMLSKPEFWGIVVVSLKFALINLVSTLLTSMIFALLCTRPGLFSKSYQLFYSLPLAIASAPAAAIWTFLFKQEGGILNWVLGTHFAWTQEANTALLSCALVNVWMNIGASFIFLLVGFRSVPLEMIESATIDGAGPFGKTIHVMIPIASPQIFFVFFLNIITSFTTFAPIRLLTDGGPSTTTTTLIYAVYKWGIQNGRFETSCVYAMTLFLFIFCTTRIQMALEKRTVYYQ